MTFLARPDLHAEQGRLIAADAQIAAAIADRLPKITLDGSYLYSKSALTSGPVAAVAASFAQTLLDWGKKQSEVTLNKALYQERLATFTQNYLQAADDVENVLYNENRQREFIDRLEKRHKVLNETLKITQLLYDQGLGDYLSVIGYPCFRLCADRCKNFTLVKEIHVFVERFFKQ
jgi:outer membrane protein TolC